MCDIELCNKEIYINNNKECKSIIEYIKNNNIDIKFVFCNVKIKKTNKDEKKLFKSLGGIVISSNNYGFLYDFDDFISINRNLQVFNFNNSYITFYNNELIPITDYSFELFYNVMRLFWHNKYLFNSKIKDDINDCPVCLEKKDNIYNGFFDCNHILCKECYFLLNKKICVICRSI
jgi:hypothetical protein